MAGNLVTVPIGNTPLPGTAVHNLAITSATKLTASIAAANQVAQSLGLAVALATIQCKTATVSYTTDGTTPTASVGFVLAIGATLQLTGGQIAAAQFISATGTLDVEYSA